MISVIDKLRWLGMGVLLLLALAIVALPSSGWAADASLSQQLQARVAESDTARALLLMQDKTDASKLKEAVDLLNQRLTHAPDDRAARLFYGYGQLFLAGDFLLKKNYMRSAELSKQGFYALDQAAEIEPDNWRLFYLRARMDAFVPAQNGRCVVATKDLATLTDLKTVPVELMPMMTLMKARTAQSCKQAEQASQAWDKLRNLGSQGARLLEWKTGKAPEWSAAEVTTVLIPLLEAQP